MTEKSSGSVTFDLNDVDASQRKLIDRAFATDDDAKQFAEYIPIVSLCVVLINSVSHTRREKRKLVEADLPPDESDQNSTPGWGDWTGAGAVPRRKSKAENIIGV